MYSFFIAADARTFLTHFFVSGGPIVWLIQLPMSVVMLYLGIDLLFRLRRSRLLPAGRDGEIMKLAGVHGVLSLPRRLEGADDLIGQAVRQAIGRCRRKGLREQPLLEAAAESLQEQSLRLIRRAEGCHLIGTVSPMIGLFGTVFGMIKAFTVLASAGGQPDPEQLAASISVALVTTFWGLLTAIPALCFHGLGRSRIEAFFGEASTQTQALLERLAELDAHQRLTAAPRHETAAAATPATVKTTAAEADETAGEDQASELEVEDE